MINEFIGQNVLCTCQSWFFAPDGRQYRALWGKLHAINEAGKTLGFIPNRSHANWFYEIGAMMIMGCQIMYLVKCDKQPNVERVLDYNTDAANGLKEFDRPTAIYIAQ